MIWGDDLMKKKHIILILTAIMLVSTIFLGCEDKTVSKDASKETVEQKKEEPKQQENKEEIKKELGNLEFSSKTLSGKAIDNKIFKDYKLTMINLWATYCGYCIKEMPDLQKIYEEEAKNGVNVLGILTDSKGEDDKKQNELAKKILEKSGVKYENIIGDRNIGKYFARISTGVPLTIFVDSNGKNVGKEFSGLQSKEDFKKAIEECLKTIK